MNGDEMEKLKESLDKFMLKRMIEKLEEDERTGIHVTDILYCNRLAYWTIKERMEGNYEYRGDKASIVVLFIGKQLHEFPFTNEHEVEIRYKPEDSEVEIEGSIDELIETSDTIIILDKKTTRKLPSSEYEHHRKQVMYYATILSQMRDDILSKEIYGAIWYLDVSNLNTRTFVWRITEHDIMDMKREIDEKLKVLEEALKTGKVPEPNYGWWCSYVCPYQSRCFKMTGEELDEKMKEI